MKLSMGKDLTTDDKKVIEGIIGAPSVEKLYVNFYGKKTHSLFVA